MFAALLVLDYLLNVLVLPPATPATGLCTILGLVTAVYGYLTYRHFNPTVLIIFAVVVLYFGGLPKYKIRFTGFRSVAQGATPFDYYRNPVRQYPHPRPPEFVDRTRFGEWGRRPLAVVCVSGGGIRAAVWATRLLCELERTIDQFPSHVPLITGASGGMLGAACYCATLQKPGAAGLLHGRPPRDLIESVSRDSLSPVVHQMLFHDLPLMFAPWPIGCDRGQVLERTWNANLGNALDMTFEQLRQGEEEGWRPSLVFTPMLVEDGRRLLITNADIEFLTTSQGSYLDHTRGFVQDEVYSRSAFNCFELFPEAHHTLKLATAVRMNASFPYVTPAGALPTDPRRRVVDAGYYDNYGGDLAAGWLAACLTDPAKLERLRRGVCGIVLIEIRDGVSDLSGPVNDFIKPRPPTPLGRGFDELSAPPDAMLAARESVSLFRNDTKLDWLVRAFRDHGFDERFFTAALFEFTGEASLSWYLSDNERRALDSCATSQPVTGKLKQLADWWKQRQDER